MEYDVFFFVSLQKNKSKKMEIEIEILIPLSIICLFLIILCYKINKKFATINFIVFAIYNACFYYDLFVVHWNESASFIARLGLLLFLPAHILILIIFLIRNSIKKSKHKKILKLLLIFFSLLLIAFIIGVSVLFLG